MGKRTKRGVCSICGEYGDLSFEHIPPRSCYNDRSAKLLEGMAALQLEPGGIQHGRISQRGMGGYCTCGRCNNRTGGMYVHETRAWVERAAEVLGRIGDREGQDNRPYERYVHVTFSGVRPLLFLKQVVYMFLCINGPRFTERRPDLRSFVLNRDSRDLSDECHFNIGLTWGPGARSIAGTAVTSLLSPGGATYLSDISFLPLHYAMWMGHPFRQLVPCEITHFKTLGPSDVCDVTLLLQVGFTHAAFPSDLRSRAALERQVEESRQLEAGL